MRITIADRMGPYVIFGAMQGRRGVFPVATPRGPAASLDSKVDMNVLNGVYAVLVIASCAAGCATSAPASDSVRVTTTLADVNGCNLLGKVFVADGPDASKQARDETVRLGGNVLLRKNEEVWNGNAYQCPGAAH